MESSSGKNFAKVAKLDIGGSWGSEDPSVVQLLYKKGEGGGGGGGTIHLHSNSNNPHSEPPLPCATSSRAQVPCLEPLLPCPESVAGALLAPVRALLTTEPPVPVAARVWPLP